MPWGAWGVPPPGERISMETSPYNIPSSIAKELIAILVGTSLHQCLSKLVWYMVHVCETLKD